MKCYVAWVTEPNRYGGYSYEGVEVDGGKIIQEAKDEQEAKNIANQLSLETEGNAGGYLPVFKYE